MKSVLKPGAVYIGDNGRAMCICCAGATARITGHDLSGQQLLEVTPEILAEAGFGPSMACECGEAACA